MAGHDSSDVTLSNNSDETTKPKSVCPYFRVGYCKYKLKCKYDHPKEDCVERNCILKTCIKRHRRACRYAENCFRKNSCEFVHVKHSLSDTNQKLDKAYKTIKQYEADIKALKDEVRKLKENVDIKDSELDKMTNEINSKDTIVKDKNNKMGKQKANFDKHLQMKEQEISSLKEELASMSSKATFKCEAGKNQLTKAKTQSVEESKQELKCGKCTYISKSKSMLTIHIDVQHGLNDKSEVEFKCKVCKFTSTTEIMLKSHNIRKHNIK